MTGGWLTDCAVRPAPPQVVWAPLLGALSVLFDEYTDPRLIKIALAGFAAGCNLTALVRGAAGWQRRERRQRDGCGSSRQALRRL